MKKTVYLACISFLGSMLFAVDSTNVKPSTTLPGKVLHCRQMEMLDTVFKDKPEGMIHLECAAYAAKGILADLPAAEDSPAARSQLIKRLLRPIEKFFDNIQAFAGILRPLMEECFVDPKNPKARVFIIEFLDSGQKSAAYFEGAVNNKADMAEACKEFTDFYYSIKRSLTADTYKAYMDLKGALLAQTKGSAAK